MNQSPATGKLSLPYLTVTRLIAPGRADSDYHIVDAVLNTGAQTTMLTYLQMQQLLNVDLKVKQDEFIQIWRTLLLKKAQDVYEKEKYRRANHFIQLGTQRLVSAPLGDLVYSIGQFHHAI